MYVLKMDTCSMIWYPKNEYMLWRVDISEEWIEAVKCWYIHNINNVHVLKWIIVISQKSLHVLKWKVYTS